MRWVGGRVFKISIGVLLSLFLGWASFPTILGHLMGTALFCFLPIIWVVLVISSVLKRGLLLWLFFQILLGGLFVFLPPSLPPGIPNENSFWVIWVLILGAPIIYTVLCWVALHVRIPNIVVRSLFAASVCTLGEAVLFKSILRFPLSLSITVFDQPALLQLASVGGWGMLSFFLWFFNFYLGFLFRDVPWARSQVMKAHIRQSYFRYHILFLILLLASVMGWGYFRMANLDRPIERSATIAVIQPNMTWVEQGIAGVSQLFFGDFLLDLDHMTQQAMRLNPSMVVFPEGLACRSLGEQRVYDHFKKLSIQFPIPLLLECRIETPAATSASAAIWIQNGHISQQRFKTQTVPFIEEDAFRGATERVFYGIHPHANFGALICFEILFPEPSRVLVNHGADVLICHSNTSYFGVSNWPLLHAVYTPIRAVESGRPIVLVNGTGYSMGATSLGKLFWITAYGQRAVYSVQIPINPVSTIYSQFPYGFWIALGMFWLGWCIHRFIIWQGPVLRSE